jgi:uncharacterized membrane protein
MSRSMYTEAFRGSGVRRWLAALTLLSALGVVDSGYLFWKHRVLTSRTPGSEGPGFCPAGGCDVVNQGPYAEIRGIPLAVVGLAGYLTLLVLSIMAGAFGSRSLLTAFSAISGMGMGVSAYLVYLQVAVIRAICFWCVVSALAMASIFFLSVLLLRRLRSLELLQSAE